MKVARDFLCSLIVVMAAVIVALQLIDGSERVAFPIDANPGAWPTNAQAPVMPDVMICRPVLIGERPPNRIVRT